MSYPGFSWGRRMGSVRILLASVFFSTVLGVSVAEAASTPRLTNLSAGQAESIMKNFSNAILFRSLEPPSANGKVFGFGVGIVGAATSAKDVNDALGGSQNIPALPGADIVMVGQFPLGLALEFGFLPKLEVKDFSYRRTAFNVRWTFTELLMRDRIPFDAALRVGFGNNRFSYDQVVNSVQDRVEFGSKALRAELAMSRRFLVFEPYLGIGMLKTTSTLSNTATSTNPLYSFTAANSFETSKSSFLFNLGTEIRLAILTIGAEASWAFSETTLAAKLGLKF